MKATFQTDTGETLAEFTTDYNGNIQSGDADRLYNETTITDLTTAEEIIYHMISDIEITEAQFPSNMYGQNLRVELLPSASEFYLILIAHRFTMYETAEKIHTGEFKDVNAALASACCETVTHWNFDAVKPMIKHIYKNK